MDRRQGIAFQALVARIEKAISLSAEVTFESPAFVVDRTGRKREHDILLTRRENLKTTRTAVECKDLGRRVGVPAIEAFRSKCDRTGVHSAIMVSSSGFTRTALEVAKELNVQCLDLMQVDSFPWTKGSPLVEFRRRFSDMVGHYTLEKNAALVEPAVVYLDGEELTRKRMHALLVEIAQRAAPPIDPNDLGSQQIEVRFVPQDCYLADAVGTRWPASEVLVVCTEHREAVPLPASLHRYAGADGAIDVATAPFWAGPGFALDLTMIRQEARTTLSVTSTSVPNVRALDSQDPE